MMKGYPKLSYNFFQSLCHVVKVYLKIFINDKYSQYMYGMSLVWILIYHY